MKAQAGKAAGQAKKDIEINLSDAKAMARGGL